jgi:hypothetical protein
MTDKNTIEAHQILETWLKSCTRKGKISRNTVAMGIVVIHHLLQNCPVSRKDVLSGGGEVTGGRSGLGKILEAHGLPNSYLKEATTQQAHQDGQRLFELFEWGKIYTDVPADKRNEILLDLIRELRNLAQAWLNRQNLKLDIDRRHTPTTWINIIVESAKGRSGGIVEQQLVGAKLERRFKGVSIPNHPAHAGDVQTERAGDFAIDKLVYHVTAAPSRGVLQKCAANLGIGFQPILLVPREHENRARILAQDEGLERES